jgi:hypothetical protein
MAIYVAIRKLAETDNAVEYGFGRTEEALGRLAIDRTSGDVTLLSPAPDDAEGLLYHRAARKVWKHWREGEYPSLTCWAS